VDEQQGAIMIRQKKEKRGMAASCLVMILSLFIFCPMAMGEEKKTETPTVTKSEPIREVTYQNYGFVQRVGDGEIVVDDHLLKLAGSVVYHAPERGGLVSKNIREGSQIGFNLNKKKEITDIWILKSK
jgi:hypothetical protein